MPTSKILFGLFFSSTLGLAVANCVYLQCCTCTKGRFSGCLRPSGFADGTIFNYTESEHSMCIALRPDILPNNSHKVIDFCRKSNLSLKTVSQVSHCQIGR